MARRLLLSALVFAPSSLVAQVPQAVSNNTSESDTGRCPPVADQAATVCPTADSKVDSNPLPLWRRTFKAVDGIDNLLQITPRILSGGQPTDAKSFEGLKRLGVTIIVSVDGLPPDVETARQFGLTYLHVPVPYRNIPIAAQAVLIRSLPEAVDRVYIHCHHGKHRGPAAAAILALAENSVTSEQALDILSVAGTSKRYSGLWQSVREYSQSKVAAVSAEALRAATQPQAVSTKMAEISRDFDQLRLLLASCESGQGLANEAVTQSNQLAVLLNEAFSELARAEESDEGLREAYLAAAEDYVSMQIALERRTGDAQNRIMRRAAHRCDQCHTSHRD